MSQTVNLDRAEIAQAEVAVHGQDPGPPLGTVDELRAGKGSIDAWEWIDIVGMGRVPDDEDGKVKDSDEAAEKQEPAMAGVIEPGVANADPAATDGTEDAVAAKVGAAAA